MLVLCVVAQETSHQDSPHGTFLSQPRVSEPGPGRGQTTVWACILILPIVLPLGIRRGYANAMEEFSFVIVYPYTIQKGKQGQELCLRRHLPLENAQVRAPLRVLVEKPCDH